MALLEEALATAPGLGAVELARRLQQRLGLSVHPRSIERALARRAKKGRRPPRPGDPGMPP